MERFQTQKKIIFFTTLNKVMDKIIIVALSVFLFLAVIMCTLTFVVFAKNYSVRETDVQRAKMLAEIKVDDENVGNLGQHLRAELPKSFLWGVSTAAHQNEGGDNGSTWALWTSQGKTNERAELGTHSWENFEQGDAKRAKWLGCNSFRLSVDWARLEPNRPGEWCQKAANNYKFMLSALKKNGITPVITLVHFALPMWCVPWLGWQNEKMVAHFEEFAGRCVREFGEFCNHWITINEPVIDAINTCLRGERWPGLKDPEATKKSIRSQWLAHTAAYRVIHKHQEDALVSIAKNMCVMRPKNKWSLVDMAATKKVDEFYNHAFVSACKTGRLVLDVPFLVKHDETLEDTSSTLDFIGVNHYNVATVGLVLHEPWLDINLESDGGENNAKNHVPQMEWDMHGWSLFDVLQDTWQKHNLPIMVTENGSPDPGKGTTDTLRKSLIFQHLHCLGSAAHNGVKLLGWFCWTLQDNFEWGEGRDARFGLFETNHAKLRHAVAHGSGKINCAFKPRESAHMVKSIINPPAHDLFRAKQRGEVVDENESRELLCGETL